MAITILTHASAAGNANTVTVSGVDSTGADLIAVGTALYSGIGFPAGTPLSDNAGNTWTPLAVVDNGVVAVLWYYVLNPIGGVGHTFTFSTAIGVAATLYVYVASGVDSFDTQNGTVTGGSGTTWQPGSVTPSANGALLLCIAHQASNNLANSIDSGLTRNEQQDNVGGVSIGGMTASGIQAIAAAINPTWTETSANGNRVATLAVFKAIAGAVTGRGVKMASIWRGYAGGSGGFAG